MKVTLYENEASIEVQNLHHLDLLIVEATKQAKSRNILSVIFLTAENGNSISLVVGDDDETVLGFQHGHQNPPYYASKGQYESIEPVMTCFLMFKHHTELPRKYVVSFEIGLTAIHEFYEIKPLPTCIEWNIV